MEAALSRPLAVALIAVLLMAALLGIQGLAVGLGPTQPATSTGKLLGSAGFAYLGGLRIFAAAVLWNRLEPQFHEYYRSRGVADLTFLMPSLYLVQRLNPQYVQSYYNAAFILAKRGQWAEAFRVAEEGIKNNPSSGLMRANYAQLLLMQDKQANLGRALQEALVGIGPGITYDGPDDEYESLAIFRTVFNLSGRQDLGSSLTRRLAELRSAGAQATGLSHDHDGDGVADH